MRSKSKPWRAPIDCGGGSFAIPLTQGFTAYIDATDVERVRQYEWHATNAGKGIYAAARVNGRIEYLHRFIVDAPSGVQVDHVDRDTLNDRRGNLRLATQTQNNANVVARRSNTSGYKGVERARHRWAARMSHDGVRLYLGHFDTPEEAARAYDAKAREVFGSFARCNFSDDQPTES